MSTNSIIWMGDIEPNMTEQELMDYFLQFNAHPQNIKLIKDKNTDENKNYCFVYFKTIKEANSVLFKLNGRKIPGTSFVFRLNWANVRSIFNKSAYVGNLNPKVDDLKLYNLFKKRYPSVHHASVITENGVSKGYGFVLFNGEEEYKRSLKEMNGINFYGNIIKVTEQKKKTDKSKKNGNFNIENEEGSSSSSFNDSEKNVPDMQTKLGEISFINNINSIYNIYNINNIYNDFNNSNINTVPIRNMNNSQIIKNNNNNSIDVNINNIANNKTNNIGINTIQKIPLTDINNINFHNNNNILYNYNIEPSEKILYSPINNNINNNARNIDPKKTNLSNNSIVSLNSFNGEPLCKYSTAKKINSRIKTKKGIPEILKPIDENTLMKKIQEGIKKMFIHYKENPFYGDKKINCKLHILFIFNLNLIVSNMFLYYLTAVPLDK